MIRELDDGACVVANRGGPDRSRIFELTFAFPTAQLLAVAAALGLVAVARWDAHTDIDTLLSARVARIRTGIWSSHDLKIQVDTQKE